MTGMCFLISFLVFNINLSITLVEGFMLKFHSHTPLFHTFLFYMSCILYNVSVISTYSITHTFVMILHDCDGS